MAKKKKRPWLFFILVIGVGALVGLSSGYISKIVPKVFIPEKEQKVMLGVVPGEKKVKKERTKKQKERAKGKKTRKKEVQKEEQWEWTEWIESISESWKEYVENSLWVEEVRKRRERWTKYRQRVRGGKEKLSPEVVGEWEKEWETRERRPR